MWSPYACPGVTSGHAMEGFYLGMKNNIFVLVLLINLLFCFSYTAYAGIGIDPMQVEIQVEQGVETKGVCKVFNIGEKPVSVTVRSEDWLHLGIEPSSWVRIGPTSFMIEPGKFGEVSYTVTLPVGSAGELMAMVFFCGIEEDSNIAAEFGIPIYVSVKGTEVIDAEVIELEVDYSEELDISGSVNIKNKGNVHIRPSTTIRVLNNLGKSVAFFGVPYGLPVQVGRERRFDFSKKDIKLKAGRYKVVAEANYGQAYGDKKKATKKAKLTVGEDI